MPVQRSGVVTLTFTSSRPPRTAVLAGPPRRTPPAAAAAELRTDEGYEKALDHVLGDKRAENGLAAFVSQWLDLESLPPLEKSVGNPVFDAFAGDNKPNGSLRGDMMGDVIDSFRYHFDRGDNFSTWLLSPYAFARTDDLAAIYNVPKWTGVGTPPTFPAGERSGLITRAALLATGSANTRPIKKGVLLRQRLLCDELPEPDPTAVNAVAQTLSAQQTTREAVEALTSSGTCAGCHNTKINGLGFATENFDALGRTRDHQALFSEDGRQLAKRAVNTHAQPYVDENDNRPVNGASELATRIAESPKSEQCFARQFVRFAFGRKTAERGDQCMANRYTDARRGPEHEGRVRAPLLRPEFPHHRRQQGEVAGIAPSHQRAEAPFSRRGIPSRTRARLMRGQAHRRAMAHAPAMCGRVEPIHGPAVLTPGETQPAQKAAQRSSLAPRREIGRGTRAARRCPGFPTSGPLPSALVQSRIIAAARSEPWSERRPP